MNPSNGSITPSHNGASLRPRTRRLISDLDDEQPPVAAYARLDISRPSSADVSSRSRHEEFESTPSHNGSAKALTGTWSQLSGFASGIFGTSSRNGSPRNGSPQRRRDPRYSLPAYSNAAKKGDWGPPLQHKDIGAGSTDKRAAKLRDEKRKALLSGGDVSFPAMPGHKRRTSDDLTGFHTSQDEPEQELLVYVHHIKPGDTLPGISIKYNCQLAALRKANRIWPNDPIQSRKIIFVPVDASKLKGKPYTGQDCQAEEDLLGDETITLHESPRPDGSPKQASLAFADSIPAAPLSPASTSNNTESEYKHESWIIFPNDTSPTEIARLGSQNLGYFPRARRKSIGFSDRSTSRNTSFDLGRTVQSSPLILPQDIPEESPPAYRRPHSSSRPPTSRTRSSSNPATSTSSFLRGPGGVGSMARNVRTIGPGNDRLTDLFGPHLYSVAPPQHQTVFTPWTPALIREVDDGIARTAAVDAHGVPLDASARGGGLDLQDVGGAIEGWVRKFARRAAGALEPSSSSSLSSAGTAAPSLTSGAAPAVVRASGSVAGRARARGGGRGRRAGDDFAASAQGLGLVSLANEPMGDLIELVDAVERGSSSSSGGGGSGGGSGSSANAKASRGAVAETIGHGLGSFADRAAPGGDGGGVSATAASASGEPVSVSVSSSSNATVSTVRGRKSVRAGLDMI